MKNHLAENVEIETNLDDLISYSEARTFLKKEFEKAKGTKKEGMYDYLITVLDVSAIVANDMVWDTNEAVNALYYHLS
jgi:hypothetical protein